MAKSVDVRYSPRMVHHRSAYRVLVTDEDAAALVFTCLMALKFDHKFRGDSPAQQVPNGLLRQALAHIEERLGTQATAKIRADLASYGVDHSDLSGAEPLLSKHPARIPTRPTSKALNPRGALLGIWFQCRSLRLSALNTGKGGQRAASPGNSGSTVAP